MRRGILIFHPITCSPPLPLNLAENRIVSKVVLLLLLLGEDKGGTIQRNKTLPKLGINWGFVCVKHGDKNF